MTKRFSRSFVEDVLQRADIVDLIAERVPLKKAGKNYVACCPFHAEKTPSFTVAPDKQFFYCFGCGASGTAVGFLMRHQNLPFREAVQQLALKVGIAPDPSWMFESASQQHENAHQPQYDKMESVARYYEELLWRHPQAMAARAYCSERGLTEATLKKFRIGFAPPGWDHLLKKFAPARSQEHLEELETLGLIVRKENDKVYDRFRERLIFPILDLKGRVVALGGRTLGEGIPKYLNSPETILFHKSHLLYGLSQALQEPKRPDQFWVVEGYMDVISLSQAGVSGAVASMGTSFTTDHLKVLLRYTSRLVFCFDGDNAGQAASVRALEGVLDELQEHHQIAFLRLPTGEDPDSWIKKHSAKEWYDYAERAKPLSQFFWDSLIPPEGLQGLESRTKLLIRSTELIKKIKSSLLRDLFLQQLSQYTQLTRLQIEQHFFKVMPSQKNNSEVSFSKKSPKSKGISAAKMALILLLQNPKLINQNKMSVEIPADLIKYHPHADLLNQVVESLKEAPCDSTAQLLERFRDESEESVLMECAGYDHGLPEEGILSEFSGALLRLKEREDDWQIDQLLKKGALKNLTDDERKELQRLLKETKSKN